MPNWTVPNTVVPVQPVPQQQPPQGAQQWAQQPQQHAVNAPTTLPLRPTGAVMPRMNTAYGALKATAATPPAPAMPQMPTAPAPVAQTPVGYGVAGNPQRPRGY